MAEGSGEETMKYTLCKHQVLLSTYNKSWLIVSELLAPRLSISWEVCSTPDMYMGLQPGQLSSGTVPKLVLEV